MTSVQPLGVHKKADEAETLGKYDLADVFSAACCSLALLKPSWTGTGTYSFFALSHWDIAMPFPSLVYIYLDHTGDLQG